MNATTWQKACTCEGATATFGRIIFGRPTLIDDRCHFTATLHPGPVCDRCDTPWTRTLESE